MNIIPSRLEKTTDQYYTYSLRVRGVLHLHTKLKLGLLQGTHVHILHKIQNHYFDIIFACELQNNKCWLWEPQKPL
jgi:hypothetical protein